MRRTERGIEYLLKKKKAARERKAERDTHTATDPPVEQELSPEAPAERPSPHEPPPREQPKIKTREAVTAREGDTALPGGSRAEPATAAGPERQRIKTRESTVHGGRVSSDGAELVAPGEPEHPQIRTKEAARAVHAEEAPAPQGRPERPQIKTREVTTSPSDHATAPSNGGKPPERLSIKTKDAYIQRQPPSAPEQPPQALAQGKQEFVRERGRTAAMKRAESQQAGSGTVPQAKAGGDTSPPAPARRGYASAHTVRRPVSPGNPDTQPVRDGGKAIVKTGRSVQKNVERTARHAIKTADRSARKTIKTTQRTAKTAARTTKTAAQSAKAAQRTAQATVKATQRAVQAARATAKAAATTAKAAAKATVAAVKAAIAAMQELAAAIAAGGWIAIVIVLVICMVGLLIASPFGIFFSGGSSGPDAVSPSAAVAQINREYADTLSGLQAGGSYDSVEIVGRPPSWADVFAVFSVKTVSGDGVDVVILDADRVERLRTVFWDMTKITTATRTVDHPAAEDAEAWTETILTITVTPRTVDDMRVFYQFTDEQNAALDSLLTPESRDLWNQLLYGNSGEIVAVALSQVGNVGGQPYWSWYGFNSRVEWCACFVSWCANECGYIDAGVIPKFAGCTGGSNWFKARGQWQDGDYEPRPGDLIFFDWNEKGGSGPQDDVPDHVGIVERVENGVVYTVEGNSGDSCRQNSYSVGHYEVWGYATPIY